MAINTQISREAWSDFFVTFSNGNCGRMLTIEVFDSQSGTSGQAKQGILLAVDYDAVGKGNDIMITTGVDEIDHTHTIEAPVELSKAQDDNGEIESLEIIDQNNTKTVLSF
jgi:hypothetical protein